LQEGGDPRLAGNLYVPILFSYVNNGDK
jgi:hypothetical protein